MKKNKLVYTRLFKLGVCLFSVVVFFLCSLSPQKKIQKIQLSIQIPFVLENGTLRVITKSYSIFFWENYTIFLLPYEDVRENHNEIISWKTKFRYFVFENGNRKGALYQDVHTMKKDSLFIDSILNELTSFKKINCQFLANKYSNILTYQFPNKTKQIYVYAKNNDVNNPDTTIIHFSKNVKNTGYAWCDEFEKKHNVTVSEIKFVFKAQTHKDFSFKIPKREYIFTKKQEFVEESNSFWLFLHRSCSVRH